MSYHLVIGAGGIGRSTAAALVARGHTVTLAARRGLDPGMRGVRPLALDATDGTAVAAAAAGAASIVNAVNPASYVHWERDWPPMAEGILAGAERSGATLVTISNLYGYGRVTAPITEQTPLRPNGKKGETRVRMWLDALAAHEAGRVRATELRASDYFGAASSKGVSYLQQYVIDPAAAGKRVLRVPMGDPDAEHSWTYLGDIGELAAVLATDERAWGCAWHVPTSEPRSMTQVAADVATLAGRPAPRVRRLPAALLLAARVAPLIRSLDETKHQFERPFILKSVCATETFGLQPTDWMTALSSAVSHGAVQPSHSP